MPGRQRDPGESLPAMYVCRRAGPEPQFPSGLVQALFLPPAVDGEASSL